MTAEVLNQALAIVTEEAAKAAVKRSLTAAIGGLAAGLPTAEATEAIGHVIGMLTEARDAIGAMK